jgi:ketosteroid isomerase-like protein
VAATENEAIVRRIFDAFARKEGLALFRFLARLPKETDGTYGSELIDVLASDDRAAALYRARGTRHGRTLELDQVLLFVIADGLVHRVLALPSDPDAFEAFWAR